MTAPDLPMRERIAEINCDIEISGSVHGVSHWCTTHDTSAIEGPSSCHRGIARADAVLTVLAVLPDTAVEAGAKALSVSAGGTLDGWEEQPSVIRAEFIDDTRARLTAALCCTTGGRGGVSGPGVGDARTRTRPTR